MAYNLPSGLDRLSALVEKSTLAYQIDAELLRVVQDMATRLYALTEDNKRLLATVRDHTDQLQQQRETNKQLQQLLAEIRRKTGV